MVEGIDQHYKIQGAKGERLRGINHSNHAALAVRTNRAVKPDRVGVIDHDGKCLALCRIRIRSLACYEAVRPTN